MRILDLLLAPWAIQPDRLLEIHSLYRDHRQGGKIDLKAWEATTGRPAGSDREPYQVLDGVAVIPIQGVMTKGESAWNRLCGMTSTATLRADLQTALQDPSVHSILLWIDSPGGMVDGTQELADAIFEARGQKPIVTLADGCMCSAAAWVGAAASRVYITSDTTATGSIGVVTAHVDVSRAEEAFGIKTTELTAGRYKRIASQYAPLSEEGRATIQAQLDHIYSVFVNSIAKFRSVSVDTVLAQMADGRVFLGQQAIQVGLVDGVSTLTGLVELLNQERRGQRPGAGAASLPTTPHATEETMAITREQLQAEAPDLLTALLEEGKAQGRAEELARVQGCLKASTLGYEKLAMEKALDGKTLPGECALAIVEAQNADRSKAAAAAGAGPDPLPPAPELPAPKPKKEATGQDWSGRITAHIEKAKAEGRTLTAAQAAAELRKQDEEN